MVPTGTGRGVLLDAVRAALYAPSVFNTQPWRWRIGDDTAELYADADRKLTVVDPAARLMIVSCGTALHHARVALAAAGYGVLVERWPAAGAPALVARLNLLLDHQPSAEEKAMHAAIVHRRTDRRPYGDEPVGAALAATLAVAAQREGAALHVLRRDQLPAFSVAVSRAADVEMADPAYRSELIRWTNRPPWSADGVPPTTAVQATAERPVPPRELSLGVERGLQPGPGTDRGALFAVLTGSRDDENGWLRAGEALSAVLLTATAQGLSAAPITDVVEIGQTRQALRRLLGTVAHPYVALRFGYRAAAGDVPAVPRRSLDEVVDLVPPGVPS